jgi:hypothetical protein
VLRLEHGILAQACGLTVEQVAPVAQRVGQPRIRRQRVDRTVDVDGRVVLHGAAVGGGDVVVGIAVRLQHLHHLGQQLAAPAVGEGAQRGAAVLAGVGVAGRHVQALGVHADQLGAQDRIDQRRAATLAGLPAP